MTTPEFVLKPFQYEPLPTPTSIRVADILRTTESTDPSLRGIPMIQVVLRTVDLVDSPSFKAMSYTWGSPYCKVEHHPPSLDPEGYEEDHKWPLSVNGRLLYIRKNLYDALCQLLTSVVDKDEANSPLPHDGKTRLVRAAEIGHLPLVTYYLERGGNVYHQDDFGKTPLHYAAANGHYDVVKVLLSYGADVKAIDKAGLTPLDCARKRADWHEARAIDFLLDPYPPPQSLRSNRASMPAFNVVDTFWIDSVCVNQSDARERNSQIALMALIYSSAVSTRIWLGPADKEAIKALLPVSSDRQRERRQRIFGRGKDDKSWQTTEGYIDAMGELGRRSWFKRRWVIQECCLNQTHEIYCGDLELSLWKTKSPWSNVAPSRLHHLCSIKLIKLQSHISEIIHSEDSVRECAEKTIPTQPLLHFPTLVKRTWGLESRDPRDSIFALLSLAANITDDGQRFVADYTMSTADVFTKITKLFIEAKFDLNSRLGDWDQTEPLEILSFVQHSDDGALHTTEATNDATETEAGHVPDLPSWVPRFHQDLVSDRIYKLSYSASGEDEHVRTWPSDPGSLKINGYRLDTVSDVECRAETYPPFNISGWLELASRINIEDYESDTTQLDVLSKTLISLSDHTLSFLVTRAHPFRLFLHHELWLDKSSQDGWARDLNSLWRIATTNDAHLVPTMENINDGSDKPLYEVIRLHIQKNYRNRCLWLTHSRRRLGLGPRQTRIGDEIWLLSGGRTPFVLRSMDGGEWFQFIGECYIHGWMHGEAAPGKGDENKESTWHQVELR